MRTEAKHIARFVVASVLVVCCLWTLPLHVKAGPEGESKTSDGAMTGDLVFAKLVEFNRRREARLEQYSVMSTYRVENAKGEMSAQSQVFWRFRSPGTKEFRVISERGSGLIRGRVFKPLMEVEVETASVLKRRESSITPENYTFELIGEEEINGYRCFVVQASPKRSGKYLFKGKIWIHAEEFAVVQIEGQPVVSPSVWIKRVDFVRRYQKIGEFWLPIKNQSITRMRLFGKNTLITDYDNYQINQPDVAALSNR